jgi:folate-binding protein YgfZ
MEKSSMPDVPAGYTAALTGAALFDRSDAAKLELTGPDAAMFLGNLCTNDIKNLTPGAGCPAYFCDPRAKVKFQAWVWYTGPADREPQRQEPSYFVETTPGRNEELLKYLDRYLISERVELFDRTDYFAQFHLAGPAAGDVLRKLMGLPSFELAEYSIHGRSVRRRDILGVPGFDLIAPKDDTGNLSAIRAAAMSGSPEVFETLRIEAGTPLFGPDIDENRFVMEVAGAARAVSYTKGCFLGQEPIVMARDRAGHVNRAFLGLKVLDGGPLPAGAKVFHDGQEVGVVTSSCHSPRLGAAVALGYLRWKHQEVGTRMEADGRPVEVLGMPPVK